MLAALAVTLCIGAGLPPSAPPDELRPAFRCLVNNSRASIGLPPLLGSRRLHDAAQVLADQMIAEHFFAHRDLADRVRAAGFEEPWSLGEVLAYGCGGLATPLEAFNGLMGSPEHWEILMHPDLRRMAIVVLPAEPFPTSDCPDPGLWVVDLMRSY